nr:MAG TPA: Mucin-1-catalytic proteolysis, STRUCTURAL PROTEIN [Caudoviricetes sp.]
METLFCSPGTKNYELLKRNILSIINKDAFLHLFGD